MDLISIALLFMFTVQLCVRIVRYYTNDETFKFTFLSILAIGAGVYFLSVGEIGFAVFIFVINCFFGTKVDIKNTKKDDKKADDE